MLVCHIHARVDVGLCVWEWLTRAKVNYFAPQTTKPLTIEQQNNNNHNMYFWFRILCLTRVFFSALYLSIVFYSVRHASTAREIFITLYSEHSIAITRTIAVSVYFSFSISISWIFFNKNPLLNMQQPVEAVKCVCTSDITLVRVIFVPNC